jgi:hypothetical protein
VAMGRAQRERLIRLLKNLQSKKDIGADLLKLLTDRLTQLSS